MPLNTIDIQITIFNLNRKAVRIIALSATLPNLADIGDWLRCTPEARMHCSYCTYCTAAHKCKCLNFLLKSFHKHLCILVIHIVYAYVSLFIFLIRNCTCYLLFINSLPSSYISHKNVSSCLHQVSLLIFTSYCLHSSS